MSHLGRPKGKPVEKYSLRPIGEYLHSLINHPVIFSHDTIGEVPEKIVAHMENGDVALLENLRFQPGEEANDPEFAEALAKLGDFYVNDAFGAAHRAHASTAGITKFVSKSAMGFLMEKELKYLHEELQNPAKPFVVIMGGAKVSDKIGVLKALMEKAEHDSDRRRHGKHVFQSARNSGRQKQGRIRQARSRARTHGAGEESGVKFLLPVDVLEAQEIRPGATMRNTRRLSPKHGIADGWLAVDIGAATIALFQEEIAKAENDSVERPDGRFRDS